MSSNSRQVSFSMIVDPIAAKAGGLQILRCRRFAVVKYSEDLNFTSNKDMGPKDFFEMACRNSLEDLYP